MAEEWLTYSELAERLNVSAEAARQKAIRARWPRRTTNNGKAQVKVDVADVLAMMPSRRSSDCPTPDQPPVEPLSDTRTIDALTAHIVTLREMVAKAETLAAKADAMTAVERERADMERKRANSERALADSERERANALNEKIETILRERALAAEQSEKLAGQVQELRAMVEQMKRRPWWRRFAH
jgi:hypothetical protein